MSPPARARTFWQSLAFACAGVRHALHSQRNVRIHFGIAAVAVIAGFALRISRAEWAVVVALIALVIGLELLNTAIEALVIWPHPLFILSRKPQKTQPPAPYCWWPWAAPLQV